MTKPAPVKTDLLLIQTARRMFPRTGCSKLNLREIARQTGVNLGMFPYYFKTKAGFTRRVLDDFYEEFFANFSIDTANGGKNPKENLRNILVKVAFFIRDNQEFMAALLTDIMNGEKVAVRFAEANMFRHFSIMQKLVGDAQRAKLFKAMPAGEAMAFMMPAVTVPILLSAKIKSLKAHTFSKRINTKLFEQATSDQAILKRVDMALEGLAYRGQEA